MKHMRKTVTVGGGSSLGNRSKLSVLAIALTLALSALVAVPAYAANSDATEPTLWDSIVSFFTGEPAEDGVETYAVGDEVENSAVADRDSTNDWNTVLTQDGQVSTQNIGRIWTDKSVFTDKYDFQGELAGTTINKAEGSDFLVGLSALSSTSNLKTVTTSTTPLDIVLVVDVSSSMDERDMGYEYTPAYNPNRYTTYYIQLENGNWQQLRSDTDRDGRYWYYTTGSGWNEQTVRVTPKTSAGDTNPDHVQFYTRGTREQTRMEALQNAANSFVEEVAVLNDGIADQSQKHRISLVKFSGNQADREGDNTYSDRGYTVNYSQVVKGLDAYDSSNCSTLEEAINDLSGNGPTQANNGLLQAQSVLNGANRDSKKVVIFFTDGNPTSWDEWDNSVAGGAIDCAYDMKQDGTQVYCIGVFEDANPSDTNNRFNRYMNAVSSNYEEAQCVNWRGQQTGNYSNLQLGDRNGADLPADERPQYYYAAEDAASLKQAFEGITTSITEDNASGSPIEDVTVEGETNPGNLAFHDELGAYMEVAGDTMQIVYADQPITSSRRTSQNIEGGVVYTYPFSGTVHANEAYGDKEANLSGLQIKVTHYNDPAKGDLVEAVIPANLIPMRNYDVDTENGTMTVSSTYPVRLFYSVQVKAEAAEQLADPSSAIYTSNYVANNNNEDGTGVEFYSNLYTNSNGDGFVGDTTATFKPSSGNRFYYFTTNTPLYTSDDGSDTQASRNFINGNNTVYYKDTYWVQTGEMTTDPETQQQIPVAVEKTDYIPLLTSDIRGSVRYQSQYGSGAYLPAQTHNEDKIDGLYAVKGANGNPTETAGDTLNPAWDGESISARMGNNGRLALELPGTLEVKKVVAIDPSLGDNVSASTFDEQGFSINVKLTDANSSPVSGEFVAQVKDANGAVVSTSPEGYSNGYFPITFDSRGTATQTIKNGETLVVYGLNDGFTYEVSEVEPGNGFTPSFDDVTKAGKIEAGKTVQTTVTNTYDVEPITALGTDHFKGKKVLAGRAWDGDTFSFTIAQTAGPSVNGTMVQAESNPNKIDVSAKTGTENGNDVATFNFSDVEYSVPGTYVYTVSEVRPQQGQPGMTYASEVYTITVTVSDNHDGTMSVKSVMRNAEEDEVQDKVAVFTNTFDRETTDFTVRANKRLDNQSGDSTKDLQNGQFTAELRPVTEGAPRPANAQDEGNSWVATAVNNGQQFTFGAITFDNTMHGDTYRYEITEQHGGEKIAGVSYDGSKYYVDITITVTSDNTIQISRTYLNDQEQPVVSGEDNVSPTFENVYDPEDVTVGTDANNAIHGVKTLTGRDMKDGEEFWFELKATNPAAESVLESPVYKSVSGGKMNEAVQFAFDNITFTRTGEYIFIVNEVADNQGKETQDANAVVYDKHICNVTVTVSVDDTDPSKLIAEVTYDNGEGAKDNSQAVFTNKIEASIDYGAVGGIQVSKTLNGRDMLPEEFEFTIAAVSENELPDWMTEALADGVSIASAEDAKAKLDEADASFVNPSGSDDGVALVMNKFTEMTLDQNDFNKIYFYKVSEVKGSAAQVAYDSNSYFVGIGAWFDPDADGIEVETMAFNAAMDEYVQDEVQFSYVSANGESDDPVVIPFVNTYTPDKAELTEGTDTGLKVTKKVTGAPTSADFTFTLVLTDQPTGSTVGGMNDDGEGNMIATATVDHDFTAEEVAAGTTAEGLFGTLTFDKAGTYTFDVVENEAQGEGAEDNWPAGWKYDTSTCHYTVVVTEENPAHATDESQPLYDGKLYIESVNPSNRNQTFTNSYDHGTVTIGGDAAEALTVEKTVTGWSTEADFNFTFIPVEEEGVDWSTVKYETGAADKTAVTDNFADGDKHGAKFGEITFTEPGTYKFKVTEDEAQGENVQASWPAGWTYDTSTKTITVTVKETDNAGNYDGKLHATVDGPATFENKYVPAEVTTGDDAKTGIQVTKKVTGHDAIEAFEFSLSLKDGQNGDAVFEGTGENKTKFDGMTLTTSKDIKAGATETKTFDDITFTAEGDYTFVIDETTEKTDGGWTYSTNTAEVTVHVKDNGNGALYIESIDNNAPEFENIYQLTPGKFRAAFFQLQGNKVLYGRNWEAGDEFTFTLTAGEGENVDGTKMAEGEVLATMPAKTTDTIKPMEDDSKVTDNSAQFTFTSNRIPGGSTVEEDTFTYTKPGTYRYLIRETNPNVATAGSGILGVSYDQTVYRLTVVVTDKGDGTLDAKGTYTKQEANGEWTELGGSDQITFTNTYSSDKVNITFNAFKVLQNRDTAMKDNEFMFHMEFAGWKANDDQSDNWSMDGEVAEKAPAPADDKGNIIRGDVTFAGMDFTADQVGYTYRYAITEVNGGQTINGVTLDASTHYVTAKVTSVQQENEDGTFTEHVRVETSGEAEYDEQNQAAPTTGAVFTNTYDPGETTVDTGNADFDLTKILKGKDWNGDKFTFTISPVSAMNGDQEIIAADSPDFPMPAETTLTVDTATGEDKDGNDLAVFSFGDITYDQEGVYTYKVAEKTPVEGEDGYNAGITYSKNEATVVVTVTDNNEGGYTTVVNISNNEFVNEYHAKAEYNAGGVGGLDITKQLNNRAMANDQFTFTIEATGSNAADAAAKLGITEGTTTQVKSAQGDAGQAVSVASNPFDTVVFDEGDDGVTFTYTIKEEGTSGQGDYAGYTLDSSTYTVTITPKDNGDGTMTVTTAVVDSDGAHNTDACDNARVTVPFENTYEADSVTIGAQGDATIVAKKTLNNDDIASYTGVNAFKFQVLSGNTVISEGANDGTGAITFDTIEYTTENLAAAANGGSDEVGAATLDASGDEDVYTFIYTVAEVTDGLVDVGISPNIDSATVTVTVTDNRHGKLSIEVGYENGATGIEFENTYGADAEFDLTISGNKKITGEAGLNVPTLEDDDFTFKITGLPADDGTPAPMPVTDTATNKSGSVSFGPIAYTMENVFGTEDADASVNAEDGIEVLTAGRAKTFTYEITEIAGDVAGVDNDTTTKTVKVTVTDESEGKITAEVSAVDPGADAGNDFTFNNVYSVDPETSSLTGDGGFTITKDFSSTNTDRTLAEGDFTFELKGKDGSVVRSAKNAADGTVSFEGITFTKPGTYEYTLSELNEGKPGVIYDNAIYNVTATAEDQGDGTLEVTWGMPQATNNGVTFSNTYTAATGSITLKAAKVLQGRNLADGEFTFELRENGKVIDTATNNAVGEIVFSTIEYAEPGEHDYEIVEVAGSAEGVTYDTTVHTMHVSVTDNTQTGALAVAWAYGENGAPVFRNTYTEPVEPAKPTTPAEPPAETIPRAGDATNTVLPAVIAASGITLAVVGSLTFARRRNK